VVVLNAANLKRLPAVQLPRQHLLVAPRPQHLAVVAKEFLAEAYLEVVVGCLEETAAVAVDAAAVVAYLAVAGGGGGLFGGGGLRQRAVRAGITEAVSDN